MRVVVDTASGTWMDADGCVLVETPLSIERFEEFISTVGEWTQVVDRVVSIHEVRVALSDAEVPEDLAREVEGKLADVRGW